MDSTPEMLADAKLVLSWLLRHPVEYQTVLALARLEEPGDRDIVEFGEGERALAERHLAAARVSHCVGCAFPVVTMHDGRQRDWPTLDPHVHGQTSAPRARPVVAASPMAQVVPM